MMYPIRKPTLTHSHIHTWCTTYTVCTVWLVFCIHVLRRRRCRIRCAGSKRRQPSLNPLPRQPYPRSVLYSPPTLVYAPSTLNISIRLPLSFLFSRPARPPPRDVCVCVRASVVYACVRVCLYVCECFLARSHQGSCPRLLHMYAASTVTRNPGVYPDSLPVPLDPYSRSPNTKSLILNPEGSNPKAQIMRLQS